MFGIATRAETSGSKIIQSPRSDSTSGDFGAERLARFCSSGSVAARLRLCGKNLLLEPIVKLMNIDVDRANRHVEAALFGLFGKRYAAYVEGRGCTLVSRDKIRAPAATPLLLALATADAL
ncbi:hypothetical protein IVB18_41870 [Bradyrhizobium sp. 186]|uniref:hypothetical protein n=1 Tax=Bradyrhizobium sp. 186 TaxID=2782654 RepID=UPI00200191F2|nr:hypothetical protein [Bradyrhizobium sp. 186]UPK34536.1 hypothetical protein IVB18_41870 [Bradyrhizobium sp. 186]